MAIHMHERCLLLLFSIRCLLQLYSCVNNTWTHRLMKECDIVTKEIFWVSHWGQKQQHPSAKQEYLSCWVVPTGNSLFLWKSQILRWKDNEKRHCCILMFASRRCRAPEFGSSETAEHVRSLALLRAQVIPSSSANYLAGLLPPAPTKLTVFNSTSQLRKLHPNCASKLEINQPVSSRGPLLFSASSASGSEHLLIRMVPSGLTSPYSPL